MEHVTARRREILFDHVMFPPFPSPSPSPPARLDSKARLIPPSLSHDRLPPLRDQVPCLFAPRGPHKPVVPRRTRRAAPRRPRKSGIGPDHIYVWEGLYGT